MLSREDFFMIKQMRLLGVYTVDIAEHIDCSERTVRRYLKYPEPLVRKRALRWLNYVRSWTTLICDWLRISGMEKPSSLKSWRWAMLRSVEECFGDRLRDTPVQWLRDNGPAYTAHETRRFDRELNLEHFRNAVSSSKSNGMAERFVKLMREDYIAFMPTPDMRTALRNLAAAFTHYKKTTRTARWDITPRENNEAADTVQLIYKSCPDMLGQDHLALNLFNSLMISFSPAGYCYFPFSSKSIIEPKVSQYSL